MDRARFARSTRRTVEDDDPPAKQPGPSCRLLSSGEIPRCLGDICETSDVARARRTFIWAQPIVRAPVDSPGLLSRSSELEARRSRDARSGLTSAVRRHVIGARRPLLPATDE